MFPSRLARLKRRALLRGELYFTLDEARSRWDYIVAHFAPECLGAKLEIIA